jgi:hypothetical protein
METRSVRETLTLIRPPLLYRALDAVLPHMSSIRDGLDTDKPLRCDCGYVVEAEDESALLDEIKRHAWEAHGIAFSTEQTLAIMLRFELNLHGQNPDARRAGE